MFMNEFNIAIFVVVFCIGTIFLWCILFTEQEENTKEVKGILEYEEQRESENKGTQFLFFKRKNENRLEANTNKEIEKDRENKEQEKREILEKFRRSYVQNILAITQEYQDILIQKYNQTVYIDDWGEPVFDDFLKELDYFVDMVIPKKFDYTKLDEYTDIIDIKDYELFNFFIHINPEKTKFIRYDEENKKAIVSISFRIEETDEYVGQWKATRLIIIRYLMFIISIMSAVSDSNNTEKVNTPIDYEKRIAADLRKLGFNARTTKASGDQGADVLASKDGVSFAIQCKMYSKPVGNKAVQEANAGRDFYKKDYGVVVSNAGFTKSARQAASACGIILLNDGQLRDLLKYVNLE